MRVLVWAREVTLTCVSCVSCVLGGLERSPRWALAQGERPIPTRRLPSWVGAKGFLPLKAGGRCCIMVRGAALECQDDLKELDAAQKIRWSSQKFQSLMPRFPLGAVEFSPYLAEFSPC